MPITTDSLIITVQSISTYTSNVKTETIYKTNYTSPSTRKKSTRNSKTNENPEIEREKEGRNRHSENTHTHNIPFTQTHKHEPLCHDVNLD